MRSNIRDPSGMIPISVASDHTPRSEDADSFAFDGNASNSSFFMTVAEEGSISPLGASELVGQSFRRRNIDIHDAVGMGLLEDDSSTTNQGNDEVALRSCLSSSRRRKPHAAVGMGLMEDESLTERGDDEFLRPSLERTGRRRVLFLLDDDDDDDQDLDRSRVSVKGRPLTGADFDMMKSKLQEEDDDGSDESSSFHSGSLDFRTMLDYKDRDGSDSEYGDDPSVIEAAELREQQVRRSLAFATFAAALTMLVSKGISCLMRYASRNSPEQDIVEEAAEDLTNSTHFSTSTTNLGAMGGVNPSGAAQSQATQAMATQAAQNAAGAAASGSSSAASGAAGFSTGILNAIAASSQASQLGMVMGIAAVAATATTAVINGGFTKEAMTEEMSNLNAPWVPDPLGVVYCGNEDATDLRGSVDIMIQYATPEEIAAKKGELEELFMDAYNNVSGMCNGLFDRVLVSASLEAFQDVSASLNDTVLVLTKWTAVVNCDGCPEDEPLFSTTNKTSSQNGTAHDTSLAASSSNGRRQLASNPDVEADTQPYNVDDMQDLFDQFWIYFARESPLILGENALLLKESRVVLMRLTGDDGQLIDEIKSPDFRAAPLIDTSTPSALPSASPSALPSASPSAMPSASPSALPSASPSAMPSASPSATPSASPSATPSAQPSATSDSPSAFSTTSVVTVAPSDPSFRVSDGFVLAPFATVAPSDPSFRVSDGFVLAPFETVEPTSMPSPKPTKPPNPPSTLPPTQSLPRTESLPTDEPTPLPTDEPTPEPTSEPTTEPPTSEPTSEPPTSEPTSEPPTSEPTPEPTDEPTLPPTELPSGRPSAIPSSSPTSLPSSLPTVKPGNPSASPTTTPPSENPSGFPSLSPSEIPSLAPSATPSLTPTRTLSSPPTATPGNPSANPTRMPTPEPTGVPSASPSEIPTIRPTQAPTSSPTGCGFITTEEFFYLSLTGGTSSLSDSDITQAFGRAYEVVDKNACSAVLLRAHVQRRISASRRRLQGIPPEQAVILVTNNATETEPFLPTVGQRAAFVLAFNVATAGSGVAATDISRETLAPSSSPSALSQPPLQATILAFSQVHPQVATPQILNQVILRASPPVFLQALFQAHLRALCQAHFRAHLQAPLQVLPQPQPLATALVYPNQAAAPATDQLHLCQHANQLLLQALLRALPQATAPASLQYPFQAQVLALPQPLSLNLVPPPVLYQSLPPLAPPPAPVLPPPIPKPSSTPSGAPSTTPSKMPTTPEPSFTTSVLPSSNPSGAPSNIPATPEPSATPSFAPSTNPSSTRSSVPTIPEPSSTPSVLGSSNPSSPPVNIPTIPEPSSSPSVLPSSNPSPAPSNTPTIPEPSSSPSVLPSSNPSPAPSNTPSIPEPSTTPSLHQA
ncbi:ECF subfamily RNA polymerase sigma-24 subunit [Seminavis robusta]|uniref:Circumsporozoite protein n=1 Tax=Seminavis robusta TaxID=568900 RepID=A0A9N8DFT0_9STRA|nr:ECF subfamily RNA polymerase sigma-24 subunit [Seminavis robusta]|eukprot:Sro47_g027940.1 ECF subfamily RNA polymerase sigma-24 subunit (1383) ;mRNA; r:108332-112817